MVYTAYGSVHKYVRVLDVSSAETIEIEYEDANWDDVIAIYSVKNGRYEYIGDEIRWVGDGSDNFKIYSDGINIESDSDTEDEEEEESEEEEPTSVIDLK